MGKRVRPEPSRVTPSVRPISEYAAAGDSINASLSFALLPDRDQPQRPLQRDEVAAFLSFLRKVTRQSWSQIKISDGLQMKLLGRNPFPDQPQIEVDESVSEMRVSEKFRVFGVRRGSVYFIIHLDPDHKIYPA